MIDDFLEIAIPGRGLNADRLRLIASILSCAHEAVMIYDVPEHGADSRIVFVNAAFVTLTGREWTNPGGHAPLSLSTLNLTIDLSDLTVDARGQIKQVYCGPDGSEIEVNVAAVPLGDDDGRVTHMVVFCREVIAQDAPRGLLAQVKAIQKRNTVLKREIGVRKQTEARLLQAICHDGLTGLPNRTLFLERVNEALVQSRKTGQPISVLFVDCDRFKLVNDTFGHRVGDLLLAEVAGRVKSCLHPADILARVGGDEFTILLDEGHERGIATNVAARIAKTFCAPFNVEGEELYITASIGIALSKFSDECAADLLRDADIAMYRAKELGKNRWEVFSNELRDRLVRRRLLDTELRRALDYGQLSVAYQPIVALADGKLEGFEALVRWQHADLGSISPEELIAVAEESGLIVDVGDWILRRACAQIQRLQEEFPHVGPLSIGVNVSAKQLIDERFTRRVCNALMQSGLRAEQLHLEITESSLMTNLELASYLLAELRSIGVQSHIDDFGTGYSSLTYLQQFPVAVLKIDRSFVSSAGHDLANRTIVKTIISLAQNLGLQVVAEGVETAIQGRELRTLGCSFAQGYVFAKPLVYEAVGEYIATYAQRSGDLNVQMGCRGASRAADNE